MTTGRDSEISNRAAARLGAVLRGKYRLDRVLGVGGMAVVYKATHRNQAEFAVKVLHPEVSLNEDIRSRFLREGYAANSIKHPGAVLVVDDDVAEDGAAFLVMELLSGIGCEELWEGHARRLPVDVASAIVVQLLDVLAAAHEKGIVHRDIKPANLFIARPGTLKVLDFGIARAREAMAAGSSTTGTGTTLGTPAFMAPEQAMGKSREIDGRTDVWAAGATLFSLVSGEYVHHAENGQEMLIYAATRPARGLATVAQVPPALAEVVDRALAFRMEDRWPTAAAMRDALLQAGGFGAASPEVVLGAVIGGSSEPPVSGLAGTILESGGSSGALKPSASGSRNSAVKGLTTSSPMASTNGAPPVPSRTPRWLLGAGVLVVGAGAIASLLRFAGPGNAAVDAGAKGALPPLATSFVLDSGASAATEPPAVDAGLPGSEVTAPVATTPPPVVSVPVDLRPRRHPPRPPPPQPPPPPQHTSASPDCDPNYTLDDQGQKHFKPECFLPKAR